VTIPLGPKSLGHSALGLAQVADQLFEAILGLNVARGIGRARRGFGEDVRDAEIVAQYFDFFSGESGERESE